MRRSAGVVAVLASCAMTAQAQAPAQPTLQQSFDQAIQAADKGDCATALPVFERLAADPRVKPGSLPAGTIAARRGMCLVQIGRADEGRAQITVGLPVLEAAGPDMAYDAATAEQTLGEVALAQWDHDAAVAHLKAALTRFPEVSRPPVLADLAQATQFDGGGVADGYIAEALRITGATRNPDKRSLGRLHVINGRVLMNEDRARDAYAELKKALALLGGLTDVINLEQMSMRGDLAEAALLTGDKDQARLYLAYTGAGRIAQSPFATARMGEPPACGPETGLAPEDSAIVEFGIGDDGDVTTARTVFARGGYAKAAAFAQAVSRWYWRPDDLARIPRFYRVLTRVEVRCSENGGGVPGMTAPLQARFAAWAAPYLGDVYLGGQKIGVGLERLAALAVRDAQAGDLPGAAAALAARGMFDPAPGPAALDSLQRAQAMAATAKLPPEAVNAIAVLRIDAITRSWHSSGRNWSGAPPIASTDAPALVRSPGLAGDPLAQDTLMLMMAGSRADDAWLSRVADDDRLPAHHPLRQAAMLRLANAAAAAGAIETAQGYFRSTGLTEEQCSLIGVTPALRRTGADSSDFPTEALRYGFEGWVRLEFDINADGTAAHARPIVAYPPFVFADAATRMTRDFRYQSSYRPSGGAACSAKQETVKFQIPK